MPNEREGSGLNNRVGWKFPRYLTNRGGGVLINGEMEIGALCIYSKRYETNINKQKQNMNFEN